ncbi:MAG: LysM peptidoglycan-binding domain-containing protein, partial [Chlamydiia bacterium]|nr:LysM peptidoglycan-binding domain-containing protein [Chlamydiia bacterium]
AKVEPPAPQPVVKRAAPGPLPKLDPTEVTVTVKRGDVLSKIAAANGTTVDAIMKANSLESTTLQIGQQLKVPLNTVTKAKPQVPPPVKPMQEGGVYTVQKGDSPWSIARKHDVSLGELLELNHLNEDSARRLRPGDKLRVR